MKDKGQGSKWDGKRTGGEILSLNRPIRRKANQRIDRSNEFPNSTPLLSNELSQDFHAGCFSRM
jgi:hypothetical protein